MATININSELNGIEISFESKPKLEILAELKENGFRWHHVKGIWYAKNTPERLELANRIADRVPEITQETTQEIPHEQEKDVRKLPSLWERCKTDDIPEHDRSADTKTIAAETRKHIKERFPEIRFSCRIGSGGWAAANEVNFVFLAGPFSKDSVYLKAVENYVKEWLWSYNYDNSDLMTDYHERGFYESISTWNFQETEPTEAQKADLADFDAEYAAAEEAEAQQREEEFQKYLIEQEERQKRWEEQKKIDAARKEEIGRHIRIVDIEDDDRYIVTAPMQLPQGKEANFAQVEKYGTSASSNSAVIKREIYFADESIYNNFCNMFLHDFDFIAGLGGTGTLDKSVQDKEIWQITPEERKNIKWMDWDAVAVFLNGNLKLIVNPEGYDYARYVNIVTGEYTKTLMRDEEARLSDMTEPEKTKIETKIIPISRGPKM